MPEPLPIQRDAFRYYVKEALANLYDRSRLQTSPLLDALRSDHAADGITSASLRETLREAIDRLRPDATIPPGRPEWLGYRLLWQRYVHRKSRFAVCQELNISRTSYYRYHQQALDAVASLLWERAAKHGVSQPTSEGVAPGNADQAVQMAVRLAHESRRQPTDIVGLTDGILRTVRPLTEEQSIRLEVSAAPDLPPIYVNAWVLRQALLSLLLDAMEGRDGEHLDLEIARGADCLSWRLLSVPRDLGESQGIAVAREVIGAYGGQLMLEPCEDGAALALTLPIARQSTILIIDDDRDTIRLYRQWLQAHDYLVTVARTRAELGDRLETAPDLVLLDVLMPQWDGWSVLHLLKAEPRTASIPIVVCSVLSQPRLALALGATAVLCKPLTEMQLTQTISATLNPQDGEE